MDLPEIFLQPSPISIAIVVIIIIKYFLVVELRNIYNWFHLKP